MPKKFKAVNTKAEEARSRKEAAKAAERERKEKEEEDKYWEDKDKHVMRKQQRKVSLLSAVFLKCYLPEENLEDTSCLVLVSGDT